MKPFLMAVVLGGIIGTLVNAALGGGWGYLAAGMVGALSAALADEYL